MQYGEYGEYDNVVHEWSIVDSNGTPQPWSMADMEEDGQYAEASRTFVLTVDPSTSATTLTVSHMFSRTDMVAP